MATRRERDKGNAETMPTTWDSDRSDDDQAPP